MIGSIRVGDLVNVHVGHGQLDLGIVEDIIVSRRDDDDLYAVRNLSGATFTVESRDIGELRDAEAARGLMRDASYLGHAALHVLHETNDGGYITQGIVDRLRGK